MLHLQRLGLIRHSPAHKGFSLQPPLRALLLATALQQHELYNHSVLGLAECCLDTCSLASSVYSSHSQVRP